MHHTSPDTTDHPVRAADILGPDRAGQAKFGAIGQAQRLILVLEVRYRQNRAKNLVLEQGVGGFHPGHDRWLHVIAAGVLQNPVAASHPPRAFLFGDLDKMQVAFQLIQRVYCPDV